MKSMMLTGIRKMEMQERPPPEIVNDTDVLIKMKVIAVCGSDVHYYVSGKIGNQVVEYPFPVGHECAGIVEKTGKAVTHVKPGDRIAIEPAMSCGKCDQCLAGRPHTCRNIKFLGCPKQAEGSMSEYIVMPEENCIPIPDHMSFDEAAISEPLSIGVYAVRQSIPIKNAKVGILGFGPIGMSVMLPAMAKGANDIFVTDKIDERLNKAKENGAVYAGNPLKEDIVKGIKDIEPLGLDVVFECCGQQEALDQAVELLKPGGKIMIIGIPEISRWGISVDDARHKEITITNVRRQNQAVEEALEMISTEKANVSNMVTHRVNFENSKEAFDLVADYKDGVMKAMIDFE